jgi:hypothetical protein
MFDEPLPMTNPPIGLFQDCYKESGERGTIYSMDLGKLSLILSCVAVLLSIPLSVLANILTPKIRDWWTAHTGQPRLNKRIQALQHGLHVAEEEWCFTHAEWEIYEESIWCKNILLLGGALLLGLVTIGVFLQFSALGLSGVQLVLSSGLPKPQPGSAQAELSARASQLTKQAIHSTYGAIRFVQALNVLVAVMIVWRQVVYYRNERDHTEKGRKKIQQRINKLRSRLTGETSTLDT